DRLSLPRDARAPINQRTEYIEETGFGRLHVGSLAVMMSQPRGMSRGISQRPHVGIVRDRIHEHERMAWRTKGCLRTPSNFAPTMATPATPITPGRPARGNSPEWC